MPVVAIDGPVGSGKSTVARLVGEALGLPVLETGAMYRAVAWASLRKGIVAGPEAAPELAAVAREVSVTVDREGRVVVDGAEVTSELRAPAVGRVVSVVAALPEVRDELVARQRAWVRQHDGGVVEGRDIGTVVFPDADLKVYLVASEVERARRRGGDESADDLTRRDRLDSTRASSPLAAALDAVTIDTTDRPAEEVAAEIVRRLKGDEAP